MPQILLLLTSIICLFANLSAYADGVENVDLSSCQSPPQGQEEFEPFLCKLALPEIRYVTVTDRIEDKKDLYYNENDCKSFLKITSRHVLRFLKTANRITSNDMHAKIAEVSPCHIKGKIYFKNGQVADWSLMGSIYLGHITYSKDNDTIHLYCPELCSFIPSYQRLDKK